MGQTSFSKLCFSLATDNKGNRWWLVQWTNLQSEPPALMCRFLINKSSSKRSILSCLLRHVFVNCLHMITFSWCTNSCFIVIIGLGVWPALQHHTPYMLESSQWKCVPLTSLCKLTSLLRDRAEITRQRCTLEKMPFKLCNTACWRLKSLPIPRDNEVYHCIKLQSICRILQLKYSTDQYSLKAQTQELICTKFITAMII